MSKFTSLYSDQSIADLHLLGGKGFQLGKLVAFGFNCPRGFVVQPNAFKFFIEDNGLSDFIKSQLRNVNSQKDIQAASEIIQEKITQSDIPHNVLNEVHDMVESLNSVNRFAVRSSGVFEDSAEQSWAGQFDTFLNVEKSGLAQSLKKCWASLFSPRAIGYDTQRYKDQADKLEFAVIIQEMVDSDISGVAFSINPAANNNSVLIEAVSGLGEKLVSGKEIPFSTSVEKTEKIVLSKSFSDNAYADLLPIGQTIEITNQIIKIEECFGFPVDIEWAIENDTLYILQARPITKLAAAVEKTGYPNIKDYEMTFKVSGLSFLFTDIVLQGYGYLDPLCVSDQGQFKQYLTNDKMHYTAVYGKKWFETKGGFEQYQEEFEAFYSTSIKELEAINAMDTLDKQSTKRFFETMGRFFEFYSKMDFQFTNLMYLYVDQDPVIKHSLELLSKFKDEARAWINALMIEEGNHFTKMCSKISQQFSIQEGDLQSYKIDDLLALFDGTVLTECDVSERATSYVIYVLGDKMNYLSGAQADSIIQSINKVEASLLGAEIKGQVANKASALVEGTVKIVNVDYENLDKMNAEINEMEEGDILVSEFTAPELMAACQKAKAIVTDLGGMLSHAAIVSRELGISCLVGTRNATKNLKDGDQITVDFDLGVVNLKKNG